MGRDSQRDNWRTGLIEAGFRGETILGAPLADYTTWRIGGPADLLVQPADARDLRLVLAWAASNRVPWQVLGNGSNLLIRDTGVRGLVIRIRKVLDEVTREGPLVRAGAGATFPGVANFAASHGLAGIEFGAGIPGTIGGAMVMNAGWHDWEIGNHVKRVEFLDADGSSRSFDREECQFGYRSSVFRGRGVVVSAVELELAPGDPDRIRDRLEQFAASRRANQPTELPSCGSVFLKPPGDYAGRLIEAAGLKGARAGAIQVSPKHANFFINLGQGTAADVLALVERVEQQVEERFGVRLQREFEIW